MDSNTPVPDGPLKIGIIGAGLNSDYHINFSRAYQGAQIVAIADSDPSRAQAAAAKYGIPRACASVAELLAETNVQLVHVVTPPTTHFPIVREAIAAGRHVLVEKPLAPTVAEGRRLVDAARERNLVLMCDHTYCYTPVVQHIRRLAHGGDLGDLQYLDSVRINLGLVQPDVDVLWDLAPHDLSIIDHILPPGTEPVAVSATGADPIGAGRSCVAYLSIPLSNGGIAHVHVNWLSPTKIRQTIIGGSERMLVWDDLNPTARLQLFDKGVEVATGVGEEERTQHLVSYRVGDMIAPALPEREALGAVVDELVTAVREERPALTSGDAGLRVLSILEAASTSLSEAGTLVPLEAQP